MSTGLRKLFRGAVVLDASLAILAFLTGGSAAEWFILGLVVCFGHLLIYFVRR